MSVLVIGAGGLGAPALLSLAHRRVREITLLDPDRVELSNLHRQIVYRERDVGRPKVECAKREIEARFPHVHVDARPIAFTGEVREMVSDYSVVIDATDGFDTKLFIHDACVDHGVPYVFGGVVGTDGQAMGVLPEGSACVRCLFDEAPPPGAAPTCAELGILGPVAGIVAARQVEIALALLEGDGRAIDRIWIYDGKRDRSREVLLRRMRDCRGCGSNRHLRGAAEGLEVAPGEVEAAELDLTGLSCPHTYVRTHRALTGMAPGMRLWVVLSSDESARNVPKSAIAAGHRVLARNSDGRVHRVLIEKEKVSMAITVRIPTPLRKFTSGNERVEVNGRTVRAVLEGLEKAHPGIKERICEADGTPKRFVNVYYKDEDIRFLKGVETEVDDGTELSIVPAIAGGR
jgi:molybdopterin-synthase adenylyltransferase